MKTACEESEMMPTITLEELAALEKLANERLESKSVYANVTIYARTLQQLCAAARRGVEADAEISRWLESEPNRALRIEKERAKKAEAALAEAVRREREECAAVCEKEKWNYDATDKTAYDQCSRAIRSRNDQRAETEGESDGIN